MPNLKLTFFCELDSEALSTLFSDEQVMDDVRALGAGVSMGLRDLSDARAEVVARLNEAGIPMIAWLLLPEEEGYWFNLDNAPEALAFYDRFCAWTAEHELQWAGVALDVEPDMRALSRAFAGDTGVLLDVVRKALDGGRFKRGQMFYHRLVSRIRADGYPVDGYHIPLIVDERQAGASLLQRLFGLVDLDVDREVLMLYTSFLRPQGPGVLWSYAPQAESIGVGSTGGGVTVGGVDQILPLTWEEFSRDLRLARRWSDDIHVFSLEGAVAQGYVTRLREFDWEQPIAPPLDLAQGVARFRQALRALLWASANPQIIIAGLLGGLAMWRFVRRRQRGE